MVNTEDGLILEPAKPTHDNLILVHEARLFAGADRKAYDLAGNVVIQVSLAA